jgi:UPF0271 protein
MNCSDAEIIALVLYQVSALDGMASSQQLTMSYVKPHGALYNDMMANSAVRMAIMKAISQFYRPVKLMLQATQDYLQHEAEAKELGIELLFEAFADRCYADDGKLLSRALPGAVHSKEKMLEQVKQLKEQGTITSVNGKQLNIKADSLCVHGDNLAGVNAIADIKQLIEK